MEPFWQRKTVQRLTAAIVLVLVVGYAALLFAVNRAMHEPPERFGRFMSRMPVAIFLVAPFETMWTRARAGSLRVGDAAPDFNLPTLDKTAHVSLSSFQSGEPVGLVFGSYT